MKPLDSEPGERWAYSNVGYIVLGMLVAKVSGQSFCTFVSQAIFQALEFGPTTEVTHHQPNIGLQPTRPVRCRPAAAEAGRAAGAIRAAAAENAAANERRTRSQLLEMLLSAARG